MNYARLLGMAAAAAALTWTFTGCGRQNQLNAENVLTGSSADPEAAQKAAEQPAGALVESTAEDVRGILGIDLEAALGLQGSVCNIYCFDDSLEKLAVKYYPGYEVSDQDPEYDEDHVKHSVGRIGDVEIRWTIAADSDDQYRDLLDEALICPDDTDRDQRVDLFTVGSSDLSKYCELSADVAMSMNDLDLDEAVKDQYPIMRQLACDEEENQRAASWMLSGGAFIYRRSIAEAVLGTDDPIEVEKHVSSWEQFSDTAEMMKDAGYYMVSSYEELFESYLGKTSGWVNEDGEITIGPQVVGWVSLAGQFAKEGYTCGTRRFSGAWCEGMNEESNVFGYFLTSYEARRYLPDHGDFGVCLGPRSYVSGGSWICVAADTDNSHLIRDILNVLTCDQTIMEQIARDTGITTNNITAMTRLAVDGTYGNPLFGGQNDISVFSGAANRMEVEQVSYYDSALSEMFLSAYLPYLAGECEEKEALNHFYQEALNRYPDLIDG